jgi:hypothetical protein
MYDKKIFLHGILMSPQSQKRMPDLRPHYNENKTDKEKQCCVSRIKG